MNEETRANILNMPLTNIKSIVEIRLIEYIVLVVANYFSLPDIEYVKINSRKREYVYSRQVAMYLIKKNTSLSLERIGLIFNGKDHATVTHAIRTINNLIDTDKTTKKQIQFLQSNIKFKAKAVSDNIDLDKDFYFIDFDNHFSIKVKDNKGIILTGFNENEIESIKNFIGGVISSCEHRNTGLYILEQINTK